MGIVTMGIPDGITLELARLQGATAFVETGTHRGGTTRWAAQHFERVYTIELSRQYYDEHSPDLSKLIGVTPLFGDSRRLLPHVLLELGERRAVHWLDGHWTGGVTAGAEDECPLLDELACLSNRPHDIILIDDARLFLSAPPPPHKAAQWPTISQIVTAFERQGIPRYLQIFDDVVFVVPDHGPVRDRLTVHAQQRGEAFWSAYHRLATAGAPA